MSNYLHVNGTQLSTFHLSFFHIYNLCHCPARISLTRKKIIGMRAAQSSPSAESEQLSTLTSSTTRFAERGKLHFCKQFSQWAMVCLQPRAESLNLAFSELTTYKIANFQLRRSRLRLDSAFLQTTKRERRFAFPIQRCAHGRATSLLCFSLRSQTSHF